MGSNHLWCEAVDFQDEEKVGMGLFRNRGPSELNLFGPGDSLLAAARQVFGPNTNEGTVLHWLMGPAGGAEGLFEVNATEQQKADLALWTVRIIKHFDWRTNLSSGIRPTTYGIVTEDIHQFASEAITGLPIRMNEHELEVPLCITISHAAIRMVELKRKPQAHEIIKEGMLQIGALILAYELMN